MNERLKELRKAMGLTQKEFAERLEVGQSIVAQWEKGTKQIAPQQIKVICSEFNVRPEWLRAGEGEREKRPMTRRELLIEEACQIFETLPPLKQKIALEVAQHYAETGKWESRW